MSVVRPESEHQALTARLARMLDGASDTILLLDDEWRIVEANAGAVEHYGYPLEELRRMRLPDLRAPEARAGFPQLAERLITNRKVLVETVHQRKDGATFPVEINTRTIEIEGRPHKLAVIRDITARKRSEHIAQRLAQLNRDLAAVSEAEAAAHSVVNAAQDLLGWDACFLNVHTPDLQGAHYELTMDTVNGRRVPVPSPAAAEGRITPMERRVMREGPLLILREPSDREMFVPFGDASRPSLSLLYVPLRHRGGHLGTLSIQSYRYHAYDRVALELLQTLADRAAGALERLRAEHALRESEERYRQIFNAASDAIFIHDAATGEVLDVNESMLRMYGFTREEAIRLRPDQTSLGESPYSAAEAWQWHAKAVTEGPQLFEWQARRKSGDLLWVEVALRGATLGGRKCVLAVVRDIADRRRAEEAVRFANRRLELIARMTATVHGALSLTEVAQQSATRVRECFAVDACVVRLLEDNELVLLGADGVPPDRLSTRLPLAGLGREVLSRRKPLAVANVLDHSIAHELSAAPPSAYGFRSYAGVPLLVGSQSVGVLGIYSVTPREFTAEDLDHLQIVANHVAVALANERLFKTVQAQQGELRREMAGRQQALAALAESEHRFRSIFDAANDGILLVDPQTRRFYLGNATVCQMLGVQPMDIPNLGLADIHPAEDLPQVLAQFERQRRGEVIVARDIPVQRSTGGVFYADISAARVRLDGKDYFAGFFRDVTERRQAEQDAARNHVLYRSAIAAAGAVPYQKDYASDSYVFMGTGIKELTGYGPSELNSDVWRSITLETVFLGGAAGLSFDDAVRQTLAGKLRNWRVDYRIRARSGEVRWLSDSAIQVFDAQDRFTGSMGIIQDITDRKRAEESIAESRQRLALLVRQSPLGVIEWNTDFEVVTWNPAAATIFGYSEKEAVGRHARFIVPDSAWPHVDALWHGWMTHRGGRVGTNQNVRKDGSRITCEWHNTPLVSSEGRVIGAASLVQDITARQLAEQALRELSGRLLAAQDDERRRIARDLHDTTAQTLAALCMNLTLIEAQLPAAAAEAKHLVEDTLTLGERAAQEIRTMSYLLHPPILEHVGLAGAIRELAAGIMRRSKIRITVEIGDGVGRFAPEIELTLLRIVQEGLGNVLRHSGSPTALIRLRATAEAVALEVEDAGKGFTLSDGREKEAASMGVGIAGMRERLRHLSGHLQITTGPLGTTLRATVPLEPGPAPPPPRPLPVAP